jgi:flagellar protein FliO/FliZ
MNLSSCTSGTLRSANLPGHLKALPGALSIYLSSLPLHAIAAAATDSSASASSASASAGGMLQVILGLGLVLAAIAGCAWLLRRVGTSHASGAGTIRVIAGAPVGQRERVVLVEVADTWLVIGVAPGNVTALHTMPKGSIAADEGDAVTRPSFSRWLRQVKEKRDAEQNDE